MANPAPHGTRPGTRAAGTMLLALKPAFSALVGNAIIMTICGVVLVASTGMDDPWPVWGLLSGLMALMNVLSLYPVLGKVASSTPLSRPVVAAMFLVLVGGIAVISGIAAAALGRFEPPPASLGDAWVTPTLLVFAAGAWIAASTMMVMFAGLLPAALAIVVALFMCVVAMAGTMAPMMLAGLGTESMVNLAIASPLVTLPVMLVLLLIVPLERLAPGSR